MTSLSMFIFSQNLDDLVLEPGFKISIYADKLDSPRQMAEGKNGTILLVKETVEFSH